MRYVFENDYITFSRSNKKLQETENVRWFIFSLPAVQTCPYSTESCRKACYAKKSERMYPNVRESRANNLELLSRDMSKFFFMVENAILREHRLAKKAGKRLIIRWHESGDFFSRKYMREWFNSMRYLTFVLKDLTVTAYTKSVQYMDGLDYDGYLDLRINIIFSQWNDTPRNDVRMANDMMLTIYTADTKDVYNSLPSNVQCPCDNCATCLKCYDSPPCKLTVAIH